MSFNEAELVDLMRLSYIDCSEEEKKALTHQLSRVLAYVEQLQSVNTDGVEPCYRVMDMPCVLREDIVKNTFSRERFLAGSPVHTGGMVRVPSVMRED